MRDPPRTPGLAVLFACLLLATALAYRPAWHGGFLWDDDGHVTKASLRQADGLRRIWLEPGATQQYYPLVHTGFWIQHHMWGDATTGYHAVSIVAHALSALLVALLVWRLGIPGAIGAAVVFALHPVHVESVAWISEQKNTVSGVLYLAAAWWYLRFDETRRGSHYVAALSVFVLALLAKTVTATLPAALLVVAWWTRGEIRWRRDVRPLVPFVALGAAASLVTIWVERTYIGTKDAGLELSAAERFLVAGRAVWFYLGKLAWPSGLTFNYPRWRIDAADWWPYLYPAALAVLVAIAWRLRRRTRAPLAALLIFVATLAPALGFVDVYPFRYSFVADHFQYLASIPVIVLASAAVSAATARRKRLRHLAPAAVAVAALILGVLTNRQSREYADVETLYRATIARNPASWLAHHNLGTLKLRESPAEAAAHLRRALEHNPDLLEARLSLGFALQETGRFEEAAAEYREAMRRHPGSPEAHNNLCSVLLRTGDLEGAVEMCGRAIRLSPGYVNARVNLGLALARLGRPQAAEQFAEALRRAPDNADVHARVAAYLQASGELDRALEHYSEALKLSPGDAAVADARGLLLQRMGRFEEAAADHDRALRLRPGFAAASNNLGGALLRLGRPEAAAGAFARAVDIDPAFADARFNLANLLQALGRPADAIPHYEAILARTPRDVAALVNMGAALERVGRTSAAIDAYRQALVIDPGSEQARRNLAAARAARLR